ncbi:MAG: hypothetical protein AB7U23_10065 [Dehalococcoidia bacterium]
MSGLEMRTLAIEADGIEVLIDFGDFTSPFVSFTGTCTRCGALLFRSIADARDPRAMARVTATAHADRAAFDAHRCLLRAPP